MDISQKIRDELTKRPELTDYRLAKDTGVPLSVVQRLRNGCDARGKTLSAIAKYLGLRLVSGKRR